MINVPPKRKFIYNFVTRLISAEVLVIIFGKYAPEVGVKFGILWSLVMAPIILYTYREEWQSLSKVYPKRDADRIANNLLITRFMIGIIPITASIFGRWFNGNLLVLGTLGLLFAIVAAKLLTDAGYPLSKEEKRRMLCAENESSPERLAL